MRAMLRAAALLLLAGCSVPLDGGKCTTDQNCPSDQRCDNGTCVACVPDSACPAQDVSCADATTLRECRTNSASCRYLVQETHCAPEFCVASPNSATCGCPPDGTSAGQGCAGATVGDLRCDSNAANVDVLACTVDATSGCHMWLAAPGTTCSSQQKLCGTRSGAPACECPANPGPDFFADSDSGSATDALPYATGVTNPPDCRIKTLTQALSKAASYASGPPSRSSAVRATGWSSGQKLFAKAKGEIFPLDVATGVTLGTDGAGAIPGSYAIAVDDASASVGVQLASAASLVGFVVANSLATGDAVALACASNAAPAHVSAVQINGKGAASPFPKMANGVNAQGACGASLDAVAVSEVAQAGLLVNSATTSVSTSVSGGTFSSNGIGMRLQTGTVALGSGIEVTGNATYGIYAGWDVAGTSPALDLTATQLNVHDNNDTGILVKFLPAGSAVRISNSAVKSNRAVTMYGSGRMAGGLQLWGSAPTLVFSGNAVCSNDGDQVGVYSSVGTWELGGGSACGSTSNAFTTTATIYGIYTTSATVNARNNWWQTDPPTVSANVNYTPTCNGGAATTVTCP